jgi:hypothetical protein
MEAMTSVHTQIEKAEPGIIMSQSHSASRSVNRQHIHVSTVDLASLPVLVTAHMMVIHHTHRL